jgi:hypothetical protein
VRQSPHVVTPRELTERVVVEFREMPGLCVTRSQAERLWTLEPQLCEQILGTLVREGFLQCTNEHYRLRRFSPEAVRRREAFGDAHRVMPEQPPSAFDQGLVDRAKQIR